LSFRARIRGTTPIPTLPTTDFNGFAGVDISNSLRRWINLTFSPIAWTSIFSAVETWITFIVAIAITLSCPAAAEITALIPASPITCRWSIVTN